MSSRTVATGASIAETGTPRIDDMRVLLTNDDGIAATGLQTLRRALVGLDDIEVVTIAPDSNRSATARSITTRSPLSVEEVAFEDGNVGYATGGTPVDCVRFAELGLGGGRPDLIVSGINHGANLGDDITYSGTVAAALEGIVLGIPAIALSQQSANGGMGYVHSEFDFALGAEFTARMVERLRTEAMPEATLINVNFPGIPVTGVEVTTLGKRIYNDELKLLQEADEHGRKVYEIYGWKPGYEEAEGTDLSAVAAGRIAVTPLHFDLTDHGGLENLRGWGLEEMLGASTPAA
jgi:5'-nucleotidase